MVLSEHNARAGVGLLYSCGGHLWVQKWSKLIFSKSVLVWGYSYSLFPPVFSPWWPVVTLQNVQKALKMGSVAMEMGQKWVQNVFFQQ